MIDLLILLIKKFKNVLIVLLIGMLLANNTTISNGIGEVTDYIKYSIGETRIEQRVDEGIPAWQIREYDVIIRVGEYNGKVGKRVYLDEININWKNIPTDIPIHKDNQGYYISEYDINLKIAKSVYQELKKDGVNVKLQIANGKSEDLNAAGRISNASNPKLYLSLHTNYYNENSSGFFFMYNEGNAGAKNIAQRLSNSIANNGMVKQRENQANGGYIGELNAIHNSTIGVLGELGFFSNPNELQRIISDEYVNYVGVHLSDEIQNILTDYWSK